MTTQIDKEWNDFFKLWSWERDGAGNLAHCDDWPLYSNVQNETFLKEKAKASASLPSISAYIIAFAAAKREGLQKVRSTSWQLEAPELEFTLTREAYWKLSASEIIRRYRGEQPFRAAVDLLIKRGEI